MAAVACKSDDDGDDSVSDEEDDGVDKAHYCEYSTIFEGNGDDRWYRIPGIVVTKSGVILAYCEERTTTSDTSDMNIACKRSTDNGETWSDEVVLAEGIESSQTMNNPVMIADDKGGVHFLYCVDYGLDGGGLYYRYSSDDGLTWSEVTDLTDYTDPDNRNKIASGPGHGIQLSNGILMAPVWMTEPEEAENGRNDSYYFVTTIYSTDYGTTWQLGEALKSTDNVTGPNESSIAELSNGKVMINCRPRAQNYRAIAYSDTGYDYWTGLTLDIDLPGPICFGSLLSTGDALLFVNPDSQTARENITVKISYNDGKDWSALKLVQEEVSMGYADLAINKSGLIFVLYESTESTEEITSIYSLKLCRFYTDYVEDDTDDTDDTAESDETAETEDE